MERKKIYIASCCKNCCSCKRKEEEEEEVIEFKDDQLPERYLFVHVKREGGGCAAGQRQKNSINK